jgi:hypothetical protein
VGGFLLPRLLRAWKGSIGERIFLERSTKCQTGHGDKAFTGGYRFEGCVFDVRVLIDPFLEEEEL